MDKEINYVELFKNIIGDNYYKEIIDSLSIKTREKIKEDISLEEFMKIVELNIKIILIIGIAQYVGFKEDEIKQKIYLPESKKYILEKNYNEFIKTYEKYINLVKNFFN